MAGTGLPLHGANEIRLDPFPNAVLAELAGALDADDPRSAVRRVVADNPTLLDGWARLSELARTDGDPVAAYAFARTGYHRGLDAIRRAGWRGAGPVPWSHEPNRGFLRSVNELRRAAASIGEADEVERCRTFLLELDPDDAQGVAGDTTS